MEFREVLGVLFKVALFVVGLVVKLYDFWFYCYIFWGLGFSGNDLELIGLREGAEGVGYGVGYLIDIVLGVFSFCKWGIEIWIR